jgi:hypothetical protein
MQVAVQRLIIKCFAEVLCSILGLKTWVFFELHANKYLSTVFSCDPS